MKPGIIQCSMSEYLAIEALSSGDCHVILTKSAFHALHRERDPSEVSDLGTAIHDGLLEGVDRIVMVQHDDWRTKAAREARDAARAEGKIPMLERKVAQVLNAIEAAKAFVSESEIAGCFDDGKPELSATWDEAGVICKARPDLLSPKWHVSVKTTAGTANPGYWARYGLSSMGYDTNLMFYERGLVANGRNVESRILMIEQEPPHGVSLLGLDPGRREYASARAQRAINIWRKCKQTGKYPSYPIETCFAAVNPWEEAAEEEARLIMEYDETLGDQA